MNNQFINYLKNWVIAMAHSLDINNLIEVKDILKYLYTENKLNVFDYDDLCEVFVDEIKKVNGRRKQDTQSGIIEEIEVIKNKIKILKESEEQEINFFENIEDGKI